LAASGPARAAPPAGPWPTSEASRIRRPAALPAAPDKSEMSAAQIRGSDRHQSEPSDSRRNAAPTAARSGPLQLRWVYLHMLRELA